MHEEFFDLTKDPKEEHDVLASSGADLAGIFRWVFFAGVVFLLLSIVALLLMEERPLRGRSEGASKG